MINIDDFDKGMVDYYAVLEIAETASADEIRAAIVKQTRTWRRRTESPDLKARQKAESMMAAIVAAEEILLDPAKRAAYDRELAASRAKKDTGDGPPPPPPPPPPDVDIREARAALARNDYRSTCYFAKRAIDKGGNAEAWYLLGAGNAGLGNYRDAEVELTRSLRMNGRRPEAWQALAGVASALGNDLKAVNCYQQVAKLRDSPEVQYNIARLTAKIGQPQEAMAVLDAMRAKAPDDDNVGYFYGFGLVHVADAVPRARQGDTYWITSAEELRQVKEIARKARTAVPNPPPDLGQNLDRIDAYAKKVSRRTFQGGWVRRAGCFGVLLAFFMIAFPLGLIGQGLHSGGFQGVGEIVVGLAVLAAWYFVFWRPEWKVNQKYHP